MTTYCVPTIEDLANYITKEKEVHFIKQQKEKEKKAAAARKNAATEAMKRETEAYLATVAKLRHSFHRKTCTHLIATKHYAFRHFWKIYTPLTILSLLVALSSFLGA